VPQKGAKKGQKRMKKCTRAEKRLGHPGGMAMPPLPEKWHRYPVLGGTAVPPVQFRHVFDFYSRGLLCDF